jgi:hypothetical protein
VRRARIDVPALHSSHVPAAHHLLHHEPGLNAINFFSFITNSTVTSYQAQSFQPSLIFASNAREFLEFLRKTSAPLEDSTLVRLLTSNYLTRLERLSRYKHSSLFSLFVIDEETNKASVCCLQAFPTLLNIRPGWKSFPGTNPSTYLISCYRRKRPIKPIFSLKAFSCQV